MMNMEEIRPVMLPLFSLLFRKEALMHTPSTSRIIIVMEDGF
jgi:hypothetical protein